MTTAFGLTPQQLSANVADGINTPAEADAALPGWRALAAQRLSPEEIAPYRVPASCALTEAELAELLDAGAITAAEAVDASL